MERLPCNRRLTVAGLVSALVFSWFALATQTRAAAVPEAAAPPAKLWVTGYYLSDDTDKGRYPVSQVDFHAMTHVIQFCNFPGPNGTFDPARTIPVSESQQLLVPAHAAGCKVLFSVGTDDGLVNIRQDIGDQYRTTFVNNLVQFVLSRGYDGLDLDYEPIVDSDVPNFTLFIQALRAQLDASRPGLLLTMAAGDQPAMYAKIQSCFDQINLMSYSLSGPWTNFRSWFDSNLYGDPYHRMENYERYPSIDDMVTTFINAGVERSKLGIGLAFGGVIWTGVTGPRQSLANVKDADVNDGSDYRDITNGYYSPSRYRWDTITRSAYLSIDGPTHKDKMFIPYADAQGCIEKVKYARNNGLGGVMLWEIGAGYCPHMPAGKRDPLLQAVNMAVTAP